MATLDRQALDKAREINNLPPLTDQEFSSLSGNGHSEEEKKALEIEAKKKEDEANAAKLKEEEEKKNKENPTPPALRELTEEEILKIVSERTGKKLSSWDDLKPKEEVNAEKAAEEREVEKLNYGVKKGLVTMNEWKNYTNDIKDPIKLAIDQYVAEAKKDDPSITDEELQAELNERFGLDDKESRKFKRGQKELALLGENIIRNKYQKVFSLDNEYDNYENNQKVKKETETKIKSGLPDYNKTMSTVKTELKRIKTQVGEGEEYEVELLDESIDNIINMMSDPSFVSQQIIKGYTKDELKDIAWTALLKNNFPFLVKEMNKQYLLKHAAGTRGIPKVGDTVKDEDYVLTSEQQILKSIIEENKPQVAVTN